VRLATPATLPGVSGRPITARAWSAFIVMPACFETSIEYGTTENITAIAQISAILFGARTMTDSLSMQSDGRTCNDHSILS
jgi:hypothetical protein